MSARRKGSEQTTLEELELIVKFFENNTDALAKLLNIENLTYKHSKVVLCELGEYMNRITNKDKWTYETTKGRWRSIELKFNSALKEENKSLEHLNQICPYYTRLKVVYDKINTIELIDIDDILEEFEQDKYRKVEESNVCKRKIKRFKIGNEDYQKELDDILTQTRKDIEELKTKYLN